MIAQIEKRIHRVLGSIRLAFRGVVSHVNTEPKISLIQGDGLSGEQLQGAEYFQHFGLSTNPPPGAMMIVLPLGGKTTHGIVIATEHGNYRYLNLGVGESVLYDMYGKSIHLSKDRITVNGGNKEVLITNTPKVRMETSLLEVTGEIKDKCDSSGETMSGMRNIYNTHTHPGDSGGTTGQPNQDM